MTKEIHGDIISLIWLSCILLLGFIKHLRKSLSIVTYCFSVCVELLVGAFCVVGGQQYMAFIFHRWKQIWGQSRAEIFKPVYFSCEMFTFLCLQGRNGSDLLCICDQEGLQQAVFNGDISRIQPSLHACAWIYTSTHPCKLKSYFR